MNILILQGPNLNLLGLRSKTIRKRLTLDKLNKGIKNHVVNKDVKLKVNQTHKQFQAVNFLQRNRNWANGLLFIPTSWAHAEYTLFETIKIIDLPTSIIYFNEPFDLGGKENCSIMVGNNMKSFTGEPLEVCERGLDHLII